MKEIIFIHGAGEGAYVEDQILVDRLQKKLGANYNIQYLKMTDEENAPYEVWKHQIENELLRLDKPAILMGHSVGASHLIKSLLEIKITNPITGIFLLAAPFWGGDGWHYEGYKELELPENTANKLPQDVPLFFYHCNDDEVVSAEHLDLYAQLIPTATIRKLKMGGHQMENDLSEVVTDIDSL